MTVAGYELLGTDMQILHTETAIQLFRIVCNVKL